MRLAACLDSTISTLWRQLKGCAQQAAGHYLSPSQNCGCSSVVERLVANEKVASSTLVTRSPLFHSCSLDKADMWLIIRFQNVTVITFTIGYGFLRAVRYSVYSVAFAVQVVNNFSPRASLL
jgi:hypothetical protein